MGCKAHFFLLFKENMYLVVINATIETEGSTSTSEIKFNKKGLMVSQTNEDGNGKKNSTTYKYSK